MSATRREGLLMIVSLVPFFSLNLFVWGYPLRSIPINKGRDMKLINIKEGVSLVGLQIEMRVVLLTVSKVFRRFTDVEAVVTSGTEGRHTWGSLHYYGYALDFRTRDLTEAQLQKVRREIKKVLGDSYTVIAEDSHIHINYRI